MKITLEMISRDLAIKFPEIIKTPAFIALSKLGNLRSTKELGVDIDMLIKDYKLAMLPEKTTSKTPVEETTRQPEPPAAVPAASIAQAASAPPDVLFKAVCPKCASYHDGPCRVFESPKPVLPDFLKEALKGIK